MYSFVLPFIFCFVFVSVYCLLRHVFVRVAFYILFCFCQCLLSINKSDSLGGMDSRNSFFISMRMKMRRIKGTNV